MTLERQTPDRVSGYAQVNKTTLRSAELKLIELRQGVDW